MLPPSSASSQKRKRLSGDAAVAPTSSPAAVPPSKKTKKSSDPGLSQTERSQSSSGTASANAGTATEVAAWLSQEPPKKGKHGAAHGQVGHFGKHESQTLEKFKKDFCRTHDISDELFNQMVQHSDRDKEPFPCDTVEKKDMWKHIYEALPSRDRRSIYRFMRRHFGSTSQRPHDWTPAQDKELIRLYQEFGPKWTTIAKLIERTDDDVSQRWKNQLQHQSTMNRGPWSEAEVHELQRTLQDVWNAKQASGQLDGLGRDIYEMDDTIIPWGQVSDRLNHCRSRQQCGDKWRKVRRRVSSLRENGQPDAIYDLSAETRYRHWSEARGSDPKDLLRRYKSSKYVHSDEEESGPDPRPQLKAQMEERMKTMLAKKSEARRPETKKPETTKPAPKQPEPETPKAQKPEPKNPVNKKITSVFSDSEGESESGSGSDEDSNSDDDGESDGESREDSRSTTNNREGNGIVKVEPRTSTTTSASTSDGSGSDSGSDSDSDSDGDSDSNSDSESSPPNQQPQGLAGSQRIKRERSSSSSLAGMDVDAPGDLDGSANPGVKQEPHSSANNSDSDEEESDPGED
ncbi:hypothetical protein BDW42DRAFT_142827 [Aspergillus taichungensis]|uniref:Myb-like DNA-binding domain protein n=1 Tax=Aspergillus taichungensis TaxID=482145 RepID=A0A2J5HMU0_9EURO|nr:hypothetical protein BDW42DRAFT_142827 [Aspergillus taichungensis]